MTDVRQRRDPSMRPPLVPLATLIGREIHGDKSEKPTVKCGQHAFAKRGEDYFLVKPDCFRIPGNPSSSFSVFAVSSLSPLLSYFFSSSGFFSVSITGFGAWL